VTFHCLRLGDVWHLAQRQEAAWFHPSHGEQGALPLCPAKWVEDLRHNYAKRFPDCPACLDILAKARPELSSSLKALTEDVRGVVGEDAEPVVWSCTCGCGTSAVYTRSGGSLWVVIQLAGGVGPRARIVGLDDDRGLRDYLSVDGTMVNAETVEALRGELSEPVHKEAQQQ